MAVVVAVAAVAAVKSVNTKNRRFHEISEGKHAVVGEQLGTRCI